jgi:L-lysine 6-transaminase
MNISKSNIKIDLKKSKGSHLYDSNTESFFLDLMSQYSSLPLGYNDEIFDIDFENEILTYCKVKNCNCEYTTQIKEEFEQKFLELCGLGKYDFVHFSSTGGIAVELAIKAAIDISGKKEGKVVYFDKSFHGIIGYANFITDRFGSTKSRLDGFITYENWIKVSDIYELENVLSKNNHISCVIIEPIKCTQGDLYYSEDYLKKIYKICNDYKILTITDEIQTGFGSTGKIWYTENLSDIIVFGKKSQVSGFLTSQNYGKLLNPSRFCVTWDSDVLDMVRGKYIIKKIQDNNLLESVEELGLYFLSELKKINGILNVRGKGFILAFDLENKEKRDLFFKNCLNNKFLVNLTGENSIRLRPNLCFRKNEIDDTISLIKKCL